MVHPVGQLFGWVWRIQTNTGVRGGHAHIPAKSGLKISIEFLMTYRLSIDSSLLSSHKYIQINWPKNVCPNINLYQSNQYYSIGYIELYYSSNASNFPHDAQRKETLNGP